LKKYLIRKRGLGIRNWELVISNWELVGGRIRNALRGGIL